jgi:hypothetical protein
MRQGKYTGRTSKGARIQYFTPNDQLVPFPYANEVLLDECHKKHVEVFFGWELVKISISEIGEKIGTFKNMETGETTE